MIDPKNLRTYQIQKVENEDLYKGEMKWGTQTSIEILENFIPSLGTSSYS